MRLLYYGLQRSGTNYLVQVLKNRYRVKFMSEYRDEKSPRQGHFRLYDEKDIVPEPKYRNDIFIDSFASFERHLPIPPDFIIVMSKDPYSWLLSYENWAAKCNWSPVSHHYIQEYNLFYGKWLDLSRQTNKVIFVRYVDLLQDLDVELGRLESAMGLRRRFLYPLLKIGVRRVRRSSWFTDERAAYYLNEKYLDELSDEQLKEINRLLDPAAMSSLGYTIKNAHRRKEAGEAVSRAEQPEKPSPATRHTGT